jgi:hypothetical protein
VVTPRNPHAGMGSSQTGTDVLRRLSSGVRDHPEPAARLAWSQQTRATDKPLADSVLAVDRIYTEVANRLALRGLDWDQITQRHAHLPELHGEKFPHGLQGLEHVTVLGESTGGGSGRPRTIVPRVIAQSGLHIKRATYWVWITRNRAGDPSVERLTATGRRSGLPPYPPGPDLEQSASRRPPRSTLAPGR